MANYAFQSLIDFTRTSAATYVDATGKIVPTPASRNLLTYTQEFDNAAWTKTSVAVYPFDPATASRGPELVTNGTFDTDTAWTKGTGWTISGGAANANTAGIASINQSLSISAGKTYQVQFTATVTSGNISSYLGGATVRANFTTGTYSAIVVAGSSNTLLSFETLNACVATIDNISVKELSGGLIAAPDGTFTADTVTETATTSSHYFQNSSTPVVSGLPYTASIYVKKGTGASSRDFFQIVYNTAAFSASAYANFNIATGAVTATGAGTTATITSVGNGWFRCAITCTASSSTNGIVYFAPVNSGTAGGLPSFAGSADATTFVWGAQLEAVPDANLVLGSELGSVSSGWTAYGTTPPTVSYSGGVVITNNGTTGGASYSISTVIGKIYRISVTVALGAGLSERLRVGNSAGGLELYNQVIGSGTTTIFVTATATTTFISLAQTAAASGQATTISAASFREVTAITGMPTDYTRNNGGVYPPRFDYDPVTLAPRGLLVEEQRTNLALYSEQFDNATWAKAGNGSAIIPVVTANAGISPDGTMDADRVQFDCTDNTNVSNRSSLTQGITITNATAYRGSLYIKAYDAGNVGKTVRITSDNIGSVVITLTANWTRVEWGGASASTASNFIIECRGTYTTQTADVLIWGAQLEAGSFATSYIPTVASQVTRTRDEASITGANFSQWYNQSEGTIVVEAVTTAASSRAATFSAGALANQLWVQVGASGANSLLVYTASVFEAEIGVLPATASKKIAAAYKTNDFAVSINNAAAATDTSGAIATYDRLSLGSNFNNGGSFLNGWLRSIRYYPSRLTNTQLQALTV